MEKKPEYLNQSENNDHLFRVLTLAKNKNPFFMFLAKKVILSVLTTNFITIDSVKDDMNAVEVTEKGTDFLEKYEYKHPLNI